MARSHKEGENIVSSSTSNSSFHNALLDSHQSPVFSVPVSERGEKVFFDANEKEVEEDEAILLHQNIFKVAMPLHLFSLVGITV
jgi:hypothetical protein